jgi:hypothetical protein
MEVDLHGYRVWQAVEVASEKVREAWEQGYEQITLIHGAPDIHHHATAWTLGRGGIKWALRGCLSRGEWNEWVYNRRSKKHIIEDGAMTLALRPNARPGTLADGEEQFEALHDAGEPPVEEDVEDSEIVAVLEDGVPVPPSSKKHYHVQVETTSCNKHYEVSAIDEDDAAEAGLSRFTDENPTLDWLTVSVEGVSAAEAEEVEKAWRFHVDVVGYGDTPEEAWGNLLLYSLKEAPPCERVPDQDVRLENKKEKGATG